MLLSPEIIQTRRQGFRCYALSLAFFFFFFLVRCLVLVCCFFFKFSISSRTCLTFCKRGEGASAAPSRRSSPRLGFTALGAGGRRGPAAPADAARSETGAGRRPRPYRPAASSGPGPGPSYALRGCYLQRDRGLSREVSRGVGRKKKKKLTKKRRETNK